MEQMNFWGPSKQNNETSFVALSQITHPWFLFCSNESSFLLLLILRILSLLKTWVGLVIWDGVSNSMGIMLRRLDQEDKQTLSTSYKL